MEQGKPFRTTQSPLVDFDAVCQKVRTAIEPARAHAISLHDERGDVLWLSESTMGPDEHNAVREALDAFSKSSGPPLLAFDLGDSRSAVLLRAVNARRALVGAIMIIMDTRVIKQDDRGTIKLMTSKLQRALADFAGMRPDIEPAPDAPPASAIRIHLRHCQEPRARQRQERQSIARRRPASAPQRPATPQRSAAAQRPAPSRSARRRRRPTHPPKRRPRSRSRIRCVFPPRNQPRQARLPPSPHRPLHPHRPRHPTVRMRPHRPLIVRPLVRTNAHRPPPPVSPEIDRLHAALRRSPIALHVQRLVPLVKGSQLKRYEVLLRSKSDDAPNAAPQAMLKAAVDNGLGSMIDRRVVTELIGWLVHHPDVWQANAVMFSVNLTTTALHDEHFIKFVGLCLAKSSLPKAMIAFEIDVPTAIKLGGKVTEVAAALHRLGCPMILDDFALRTECFDLLRLPGVRYIKLAPEITAKMRTDKLAQAAITAVVQMARVLGMHTVAKRTESPAEQEWLTALGVDFIQSHAMSPPAAIESLSKGQKPKS